MFFCLLIIETMFAIWIRVQAAILIRIISQYFPLRPFLIHHIHHYLLMDFRRFFVLAFKLFIVFLQFYLLIYLYYIILINLYFSLYYFYRLLQRFLILGLTTINLKSIAQRFLTLINLHHFHLYHFKFIMVISKAPIIILIIFALITRYFH